MSYGTILLMAVVCFLFGGAERTPWTAVTGTGEEAESTLTVKEDAVSLKTFNAETFGPETAGSVQPFSLASPMELQAEEERQWYAYLRFRALHYIPSYEDRLKRVPVKCGTEP